MDQGLKERLIGAAVLVALGVWLIPWVLDGKKEQVELDGSEAALRLPTPEEPLPFRTQTLSLNESEPFASEPAPAEALANAAAAQSAQPPGSNDANEPEHATTAPEEPVVARAAPTPVPSVERPTIALPKPSVAPPKPIVVPQATPVTRTDAKGDWVVQLGSFGEEENAKRLAQRVNTYGYKPDVSNHRASGRAMYRVRVGPYATRAQADATVSALSAHGFVGQVVAAD